MKSQLETYLVMAGGGAKGLGHLALIKALENVNKSSGEPLLRVEGAAGASIGSIVAALHTVGYTADDLMDPESGTSPLLKSIDLGAGIPDLFGRKNWKRMLRLIRLSERLSDTRAVIVSTLAFVGIVSSLYYVFAVMGSWPWVFLLTCALVAVAGWCMANLVTGYCSTAELRSAINRALARKLGKKEEDDVLFSEVSPKLRIVATNVSKGTVELFSNSRTPNVAVADAVAASMAIPFVFAPVRIAGCDYCDGGIVSNIPAWSLNDQMKISPRAVMILSDFPSYVGGGEGVRPTPRHAPLAYFWNLLNSMLFGARHFEIQTDGHSYVASITTPLSTLSLHKSPSELARIYRALTPLIQSHVEGLVREREAMENLCKDMHTTFRGFADGQGKDENLRVSVLLPVSEDTTTLKRAHGWNSDSHSDSYTYIAATGANMAGRVFTTGTYELEKEARPTGTTWHEQAWVWMVPIMQGRTCVGVVSIDSSEHHQEFGLHKMNEGEIAEMSRELSEAATSTVTALAAARNWRPPKGA